MDMKDNKCWLKLLKVTVSFIMCRMKFTCTKRNEAHVYDHEDTMYHPQKPNVTLRWFVYKNIFITNWFKLY